MNVPDNAQTVEVEERDLKRAIAGAAEELGLHPAQVDYKLDMSHFRSITGVSVAKSTVKIVAWKSDRDAPAKEEPEAVEAEEPAPKKRRTKKKKEEEDEPKDDGVAEAENDDAEDDDKPKKRRRRTRKKKDDEAPEAEPEKPEQLRGAETETTEASIFAQQWFEKLLELMGVEGKVVGTGNEQRVHLAIEAERAGRIVGKRGATLGAIRHLLSLALERRFGGLTVDVDVDGDRDRKKTPSEKPRRERSRDDRRDRDDRGRGRGRRDRRPKGKYDEDKLRALARRAAEKAVETGKTFTINLQLNSYDRRVVHLEISEIDGVDSHSEEREVDGQMMKFVQVVPDAD